MSVFRACYDLQFSPPTFDVIGFAVWAEGKRLEWGCDQLAIEFAPGPAGGFRQDSFWPHTLAERIHMRDHVAVPICKLLPSCRNVVVLDHRPKVGGEAFGRPCYGPKYLVDGFRRGIRPLRSREPVKFDRDLVTITLRESEHWPERNSNVAEWLLAAHMIERKGYNVVVIRDFAKCSDPLPHVLDSPAGSRNIDVRADWYASARVNLGVSNGPMWMAFAMDAPAIIFKPADDRLGKKQFSSAYLATCGIPPGEQIPGSPSWQRLAWCDDTAANIVAEFERFIGMDHGGRQSTAAEGDRRRA